MRNSSMLEKDEYWSRKNIFDVFREKNCDGCSYVYEFPNGSVKPFCIYRAKIKLNEDKTRCFTRTENGNLEMRSGC